MMKNAAQTNLITLDTVDSDIGKDDNVRKRVEFCWKTILMMNDEIGHGNLNF